MITWGEVGEDEEREGDQIYGDGGRLDFGWSAHNAIYKWRIIELYTWNLYSYEPALPNKFNLKVKDHCLLAF